MQKILLALLVIGLVVSLTALPVLGIAFVWYNNSGLLIKWLATDVIVLITVSITAKLVAESLK